MQPELDMMHVSFFGLKLLLTLWKLFIYTVTVMFWKDTLGSV